MKELCEFMDEKDFSLGLHMIMETFVENYEHQRVLSVLASKDSTITLHILLE